MALTYGDGNDLGAMAGAPTMVAIGFVEPRQVIVSVGTEGN